MKTQYITDFVNESGQINETLLLRKIDELCRYRFYRLANEYLNEFLKCFWDTTKFENVNNDLVVLGFDDECTLNLLIDKLNEHI